MRNKKVLIAIMLVVLFGVIGGTIAYYQSSDTFTNEFNTGKYVIKAQEIFESPDKWLPGETTPKKISVTNQGNVDAAVKVCFREKWEDENGNPLPLNHGSFPVALLNIKQGFKNYWLKDCNSDCVYYYKKLAPNETTEDLLESVTYNPNVDFGNTRTCTTDPTTHKTTCINSVNDYSGAKYTLYVDIETVQYDQYETHFGNVVAEQNGFCSNLNIMRSMPTHFPVIYALPSSTALKESELDNYVIDKNSCKIYYTDTISPENKYYSYCSNAYYVDDVQYQPNQRVNVKSLSIRRITGCNHLIHQEDGSILCDGSTIENDPFENWTYKKNGYTMDDDEEMFDNLSDIELSVWNQPYGEISLRNHDSFIMPRHIVLLEEAGR